MGESVISINCPHFGSIIVLLATFRFGSWGGWVLCRVSIESQSSCGEIVVVASVNFI